MTKLISVPLPRNLDDNDLALFEPFQHYNLNELKVGILEDVFVTYSGLCRDKYGLIKESYHDSENEEDILKEVSKSCESALDNPDNLIELIDENTYLLVHHPWLGNYYHYLCEGILRLWTVKEKLNEMILILPEVAKSHEFILSSIEPFSFKGIFFIPHQKSLWVKNLCISQIKPVCDTYHSELMREIGSFYREYARNVKKMVLNEGSNVYISRNKAKQRRVENSVEIEDLVSRYGFDIVSNEDYSFWQQIALYSNVKCLISIHGAGLTNMLFMEKGAKILEMHKKKTNLQDWHSFAFWYLSDALGFDYYQQVCEPVNPDSHFFEADFIIDAGKLEANLIKMGFVKLC